MGAGFQKRIGELVFGLILAGLIPSFIFATTLIQMSVAEQSQASGWIGRIRVDAVKVSDDSKILTSVIDATALEIYKGEGTSTDLIRFEVPGGQRGNQRVAILGLPQFIPGHEYIVFLDSRPSSLQGTSYSAENSRLLTWTAYKVVKRDGERFVIQAGNPAFVKKGLKRDRHQGGGAEPYSLFIDSIYRELN